MVFRHQEIEKKLAEVHAWLGELQSEAIEQSPAVTRDKILDVLRQTSRQLLAMGREMGPILERLIPDKIWLYHTCNSVPRMSCCGRSLTCGSSTSYHTI